MQRRNFLRSALAAIAACVAWPLAPACIPHRFYQLYVNDTLVWDESRDGKDSLDWNVIKDSDNWEMKWCETTPLAS